MTQIILIQRRTRRGRSRGLSCSSRERTRVDRDSNTFKGTLNDADDAVTDAVYQVHVMLRVCPTDTGHSTVLNVDARSRQVVLHNPTAGGATASNVTAQRHIIPPKMFAFDAVFTPSDCLVCVFMRCTDFSPGFQLSAF